MVDKFDGHFDFYRSNSRDQIVGADSPVTCMYASFRISGFCFIFTSAFCVLWDSLIVATDSGLRGLVKKIRDSAAFEESIRNGPMSDRRVNAILKSDLKDPFILLYLGKHEFKKTPDNEKQRRWWLANSEFSEDDLDLISDMANLFRPMDASTSDKYHEHMRLYCLNSQDQIVGADSSVACTFAMFYL